MAIMCRLLVKQCVLGSFGAFTLNFYQQLQFTWKRSETSRCLGAVNVLTSLNKQISWFFFWKNKYFVCWNKSVASLLPMFNRGYRMDQCGCLCDVHVFSQWPSGTWQGSSRAGLRKERPSIWSMTPPGGTKVKSNSQLHFSLMLQNFRFFNQILIKNKLKDLYWDR